MSRIDSVKKYDTVVSSGQSALRALLAMNGGAIIVFLTFVGHLFDQEKMPAQSIPFFVAALLCFIGGIVLALLSYGSIFITNCFSSVNWRRSSNVAFVVTMLCGFGSLAGFVGGSLKAVHAFQSVAGALSK